MKETRTILLVEDQQSVSMAQAKIITGFGYSVITARTGEEAVEIATGANSIDLILMDIELGPGMNGMETARNILSKRDIPIVFLTSHVDREIAERISGIPHYGYVIKTTGPYVLHSSIEMALELHDAYEKKQAEESLLKTLLDTIPDQVWLKDADGVFIACNRAFEKFHGTEESKILGKTDYNLVDRATADSFRHYDQRAVETKQISINEEWVTPAGDKKRILLETIKTPMFTRKGEPRGVLGIARDITERSNMEEALALSEAKYRNLVEKSLVGVYIIQDDRFPFANDQFCRIFGYPRDEMINSMSPLELSSVEDKDMLKENIRKRISGEVEIMEFQFRGRKKDGTLIYVQVLSGTMQYMGKPAVIGTCLDVTKTIRAEQELQDTNRKLKLALQSSRMGTWDWDYSVDRVTWSEETLRIFDTSKVEFKGHFESYLDFILPEDRTEIEEKIRLLIENHSPSGIIQYEHRIVTGSGEVKWIEVRGAFLPAETGEPTRMMGIVTDITERKRIEEKLVKSNREKEIFLQDLKHRIKNTLGIISSLLSLQVDKLDTERKADNEIYNAFQDSIARITSIGQVYEQLYNSGGLNDVELTQYIRDAIGAFSVAYAAEKNSIRFLSDLEDLYLDVKRTTNIGLIMNELLTNAVKYAYPAEHSGEIRVELGKVDNDIVLSVSDDGKGLGKDFDGHDKGTGLLIIDLLTEEINGSFSIKNDNGTKARLTLPL
ncbi:MAG: PAS domain S-box protein [Spirochaetales bacterium]|nr:PAS domain S-box protein [Spirochaetales bacterium]